MSSANVNPTSRETHNPSTQAAAAQASHIQTVVPRRIPAPFPLDDDDETYGEPAIERKSTGVPFLDDALGGGHCDRMVYSVRGSEESRVTFAQQLAVECGFRLNSDWNDAGQVGPRPIAYLFSYEEDGRFVMNRMLAHVALVPLNSILSPTVFSTSGTLKPYEREMFQSLEASGEVIPGEKERLRAASMLIEASVVVVDFSGHTSTRVGEGSRLHDEVLEWIETDTLIDRPGVGKTKPGVIIIDGVDAAVRKNFAFQEPPRRQQRDLLEDYPLLFKSTVLNSLGCPGWVFGQYNTEGRRMATARSVADGYAARFNLGNATKNLLRFSAIASTATLPQPIWLKHDLQLASLSPDPGPEELPAVMQHRPRW